MTFKHVKFEDSAVMRSLEKVAQTKGWTKEEPLKKSASNQTDLSAGINLTENILKLCSGLRSRGFDKYADELEDKFIVYKQAQTLYETTSEKGEDLIDAAHPKGSHKLEGVDADEAVFETILDQHVKNLKMIEKTPTGKLASSRDVLNAVKIVLAEDSNAMLQAKMNETYQRLIKITEILKGATSESPAANMGRLQSVMAIGKWLKERPVTDKTVKSALAATQNAKASMQYMDPTERDNLKKQYDAGTLDQSKKMQYIISITNYTAWNQIQAEFDAIMAALNDATKLLQADNALLTKIDTLVKTLGSYKSLLMDDGFTPQDRADGTREINGFIKRLELWKSIFANLDPETKAQEAPRYMEKVNQTAQEVEQLHKEIIGA